MDIYSRWKTYSLQYIFDKSTWQGVLLFHDNLQVSEEYDYKIYEQKYWSDATIICEKRDLNSDGLLKVGFITEICCDKNITESLIEKTKKRDEYIEKANNVLKTVTRRLDAAIICATKFGKKSRGKPLGINELLRKRFDLECVISARKKLKDEVLKSKIKGMRKRAAEAEISRAMAGTGEKYHNFTSLNLDVPTKGVLSRSGGFAPSERMSRKRQCDIIKRKFEEIILRYLRYIVKLRTGEGYLGKVLYSEDFNIKLSRRKEIWRYLSHPDVDNAIRRFIYKALSLIDHSVKRISNKNFISNLNSSERLAIEKLKQQSNIIVREADKGLGWSLNSKDFYIREFRRHLNTEFYEFLGEIDIVDQLKRKCKHDLIILFEQYPEYSYLNKGFMNKSLDSYVLPSMNLMPKVHKLTSPASVLTERILTARPIITGYGWCIVEVSKHLQKEFRFILDKFTEHMFEQGLRTTVISSSLQVLNSIRELNITSFNSFKFVVYDFKDLYTNILSEDVEICLKEIFRLLQLDEGRCNIILSLFSFCNNNNYFNVGRQIFKQVKGMSMGCYYSKEVADLVLLYSEYKFMIAHKDDLSKLLYFGRYADDGLILCNLSNLDKLIELLNKLILYYPKNLVLTFVINPYHCVFLDLDISVDDITLSYGSLHTKTFFKKHHKFSYLDNFTNHNASIIKGFIKGESIRYARNSSTKEDYLHTLELFIIRLSHVGHSKRFCSKQFVNYDEYKDYTLKDRIECLENYLQREGDFMIIKLPFDRYTGIDKKIKSLVKDARKG